MNKTKFSFIISFLMIFIFGCTSSKTVTNTNTKMTAHEMVEKNLYAQAKSEFSIQSDINAIDKNGNTVLHLAAEKNSSDLATFFILKGADPALKNYQSDTPLHIAIKNHSFEAAQAICLISASSLFERDGEGFTALDLGLETDEYYYDIFITTKNGEIRDIEGQSIVHYFVKTKNLKAIQQCVKKQLPISVKDNSGKTPLDVAFENLEDEDSVEIAAELIMGGAEEVETDFSYFQDAIIARNVNSRFNDGQTPLHLAAIYGHTAIAKYLLECNAVTTAQDSSGATPLHEAVRYGNLEIAKALLNSGANVNAKDNLGKTPISLIFPRNKMFETYSLLINHKADIEQKDMFGDSILHTATMMNCSPDVLRLLIKAGADINARNKEGVTPLSIAVQQENLDAVKLFTVLGADIHTKDTKGLSPLLMSFCMSDKMLEAVVTSKNALSQDSEGNTPLHIALLTDSPLQKIQYIISLTDDVNIRNRDGNSALYMAVLKNRQKVGEMLLEKNADIFSSNTNNNSPLRLALKYGGSVQDWLITSKTINSKDGSGNSVLHYAAEWEYKDAISNLLAKGAVINAKNANGETPLFSAVKTNNPEVIQLILNGGGNLYDRDYLGSTTLHTAIRWDAPKSIDKLILEGIEINAQNSAGKSALSEAVITSKYEITKTLLENGADVNCSDANGVSVLMDCVRGGNPETVGILLEYGANPNLQEINGKNAYHEAATLGNIQIIELIRKAGGNPLSRDKQGITPFSIVLKKDYSIIKSVLGDSVNITDSDGNSPIHIVVQTKNSDELLKKLIYDGYPLDSRNADGYTPLNLAIEQNRIQTALILLENGANPFQMIDKKGRNGVTIALEKNNAQMISNIVQFAGEKTDVQGNTILHYAAKTASVETVKQLLSFGINKDKKNVTGDNAYTIALRWRRKEIAELLK